MQIKTNKTTITEDKIELIVYTSYVTYMEINYTETLVK